MSSRPTPVLLTGTTAGAGKTWLASTLGRTLAESGRRVVAIKPVETGCAAVPDSREDGHLLARATGQMEPTQALLRFQAPLVPAIAAELEGAEVDFDEVVVALERLSADAEVTLLESHGGLLSPITWEWDVADLARAMGASVLVVAPDAHGAIDDVLLALSVLELGGLPVLGVALIEPETHDPSTGRNAAAIARLSGLERVCEIRRTDDPAVASASVAPILAWIG